MSSGLSNECLTAHKFPYLFKYANYTHMEKECMINHHYIYDNLTLSNNILVVGEFNTTTAELTLYI